MGWAETKHKDDPPPILVGSVRRAGDDLEDFKKRLRRAHNRACERSSASAVAIVVSKDLFETALFHAEREKS